MKNTNSASTLLDQQNVFYELLYHYPNLVVWQVDLGKRNIGKTQLHSLHFESGHIQCEVLDFNDVVPSLPLYFYSEEGQLIFKTTIIEIRDHFLICSVPKEVKHLGPEEVDLIKVQVGVDIETFWKTKRSNQHREDLGSDFVKVKSMRERSLRDQDFLKQEFTPSLDEEDKLFADKRESPRARPTTEKWVKLKLQGKEEVHVMKLFDLSRGGLGFMAKDAGVFPKGSEICILGFDQFDLDDPLIGEVMGSRPVDELQVEFKVGIKFNEGQS